MKVIKTPLLLTAFLSLLTSCSNNSIAGTYGFQMGKENSTHFGIYLTLTDDYTTVGEVSDQYKVCEFAFTLKFNNEDESMASLLEMIGQILKQEGDTVTLQGFYAEGDKVSPDGEKELKVGFDLSFLKDELKDVDPDVDFPSLDPTIVEKLIYTTYANDVITMYVPVGQADAIFQLYWYGVDVSLTLEDGLTIKESPYGVHEVGTHPTADDIAEINKTFKEGHEMLGLLVEADLTTYRDYYTLAMGLNKKI